VIWFVCRSEYFVYFGYRFLCMFNIMIMMCYAFIICTNIMMDIGLYTLDIGLEY